MMGTVNKRSQTSSTNVKDVVNFHLTSVLKKYEITDGSIVASHLNKAVVLLLFHRSGKAS